MFNINLLNVLNIDHELDPVVIQLNQYLEYNLLIADFIFKIVFDEKCFFSI